jgi:hypothetical protein
MTAVSECTVYIFAHCVNLKLGSHLFQVMSDGLWAGDIERNIDVPIFITRVE